MKYKNMKWIMGIISFGIGVMLLVFGFYGEHAMHRSKGIVDNVSDFIRDNTVKGLVKGQLHRAVDKYKMPVTLCFIGSVVFIVGGGALVYLSFRKKR